MIYLAGKLLPSSFYQRDPKLVAKDLLGKLLLRRLQNHFLKVKIVETEAYYGLEDPASRAFKGKKLYNALMWGEPGRLFIYNVHKYWMLNVVAHELNDVGAVLIRAVEPIGGITVMQRNRPTLHIKELTNGPGKFSLAFKIDKSLNGMSVTSDAGKVFIVNNPMSCEIGSSHRIGVQKDVEKELRFYIKGNKFLSKTSKN